MKICLVNSPNPYLTDKEVFPPLGLLYLSSYMKQCGYYDIELMDMIGKTKVENIFADIYFLYVSTPQSNHTQNVIKQLKEINPEAKFIAGGPHASVAPDDLSYFDSVVIGEGEIASINILQDYPNLKKIYVEDKMDINHIPFPDRTLLDINKYAENYKLSGTPSTTYISSRGCSYGKCAFCCKYWSGGVRYRSAQNIYEEIKYIKETFKINGVAFFDDDLLSNKKRIVEICNLIKTLNIKWRCLSRVSSLNENIINTIANAGCEEIALGIESADQDILNKVSKNIDINEAKKIIKLLKDYDIRVKELFIVGLPGESRESLEKMERFIQETQPHDIDLTIFSPFPGSDIYINSHKYDIKFDPKCKGFYKGIKGKYSSTCRISTSHLTFEEILQLRDEIEDRNKPQWKVMI